MNETRENRFVILLKESERAAIERAANAVTLPASTFARSILMQRVEPIREQLPSALQVNEDGARATI